MSHPASPLLVSRLKTDVSRGGYSALFSENDCFVPDHRFFNIPITVSINFSFIQRNCYPEMELTLNSVCSQLAGFRASFTENGEGTVKPARSNW